MPRQKKNNPKTSESKASKAEKLKEAGNVSVMAQNYDKAIQQYSEAIELDNTNHVYYNNRSLAYFIKEKFNLSLQDAQKSINLNNKYAKAYLRKALSLLEMDQLEEAIKCLNDAEQFVEKQEIQELQNTLQQEWKKWNVLPQDDEEIVTHDKMLQWLTDGHSTYDKLKMQYYEKNYRGVHAAKKIYNKEVILYVPKSHLITLEMAKQTQTSRLIIENHVELLSPKHSFLSTFLLQEKKNPNSIWKKYLDILPSNYDCFPIFFPESDMQWLNGSPFQNQVREKINDIQKDYNQICNISEEFKQYSFKEFCWARMSASSRIFGLNIEGQKTDAFVPLADMLNHKRPRQTSWRYSDDKGGFIIESLEDIDRGEQIYDSYGRKCNSRFLLNYGFIVLENDANEVAIKIEFEDNDSNIQIKKEQMQDQPMFKIFRILENYEEQNTIEFLGYVRYTCHIDKDQLLLLSNYHEQHQMQEQMMNNANSRNQHKGYKPQKTPPISIDNEKQMWIKVQQLCQTQYDKYESSLEQDLELLKNDQALTQNQKNCILLRSGEKKILMEMINMSKKMLVLLDLSKKEVQSLISKQEYFKYQNYISKVIIQNLKLKQQ